MKNEQKSVNQITYDHIKEYLSPTYLSSLRIIGLLKDNVMHLSKQIKVEPIVEKEGIPITQVEKTQPLRKTTRTKLEVQAIPKVLSREIPSRIYTLTELYTISNRTPLGARAHVTNTKR